MMMKKMSSAKDIELDQMQLKVKAFEGEFMCACVKQLMLFHCLAFVNVHMSSLHEYIPTFMHTYLPWFCIFMHTPHVVYLLRWCISTNVLTEILYEKKQSVVTYDPKVAKLQAPVERLESVSAEKDAEYEAITKKSEGEVIL